jgi:hypothetical protein
MKFVEGEILGSRGDFLCVHYLGCYAVLTGKLFLMFRMIIGLLSSGKSNLSRVECLQNDTEQRIFKHFWENVTSYLTCDISVV